MRQNLKQFFLSLDYHWVWFTSDSIMLIFFEKVKLLAKDLEPVISTESECLYFLRLKIFPVYSILLQMSKFMSLITVALQGVQ